MAYSKKALWGDFNASIMVFLVSLPLNLGIALAAGAPPLWGLASAIVAGILVGAISGSPLRVSGPADSGMAFVAALGAQLGLDKLGLVVFMAGVVQFIAGRLQLGQWFRAVAPSVIHGMLSGIGVLIVASQLHALMDAKPHHSGLINLMTLPDVFANTQGPALLLGLLTLGIYVLWNLTPSKWAFQRIPGALVAVLLGSGLAAIWHLPVKHVTLPENLMSGIPLGALNAHWGALALPEVWSMILGLAVVLSAETLLDAMAVDKMVPGHRTRYNWDLSSQGIGNMVCGFMGTMPISGVIVRSVTNVKGGAQTRMACVYLGLWLLLAVSFAQPMLTLIPTTCLSAVLLYVGFKLVNLRAFGERARLGKGEFLVFVGTLAVVVAQDILAGVAVGMALALLKTLYVFSRLSIDVFYQEPKTVHLTLAGAATFIRLPQLAAVLEKLPADADVHVHLRGITYLDHACLELLNEWEDLFASRGGRLAIDWHEANQKQRPHSLPSLSAVT
jgi:MFS superfamily sulfate permease-like transporter